MSELGPGDRFGPYLVEDELGRGGMSVVYRAVEDSLSRTVALKIMASHLHDDENYRMRFHTEARAAAAISHPHIVPIYAFGEEAGRLYIAMQFIQGTDLRHYVATYGQLDPPAATAILEQVAYALDAIHARGMTHRDIKPDNILVSEVRRDGIPHVYLADFGLTRAEGDAHLTSTGQMLGTVTYAAPEQMLGEHVDGRADIYSLACVLFEAVTGGPPFQKNASAAVVYAHVTEDRPAASSRRADLPPSIDAVLAKGMAKHRDDRYRTASELIDAFRLAADQWTPGATPLPTEAPVGPTPVGPVVAPGYGTPPVPAAPPEHWQTPAPVDSSGGAAAAFPSGPLPSPTGPDTPVPRSGSESIAYSSNPAGPAPSRRRSVVVGAAVAAVVLLVALVGGGLVLTTRKTDAGPTQTATGSPGSSPQGTSPDDPALATVVTEIDKLLRQTVKDRQRVRATLDGVVSDCKIKPQDAVTRLDEVANSQATILRQLRALDVSATSEGAQLVDDLRLALERQQSVDQARRAWLQHAVGENADAVPPGCPNGAVPADDNAATADAEDQRATALKEDFAAKYNDLATRYGLQPLDSSTL